MPSILIGARSGLGPDTHQRRRQSQGIAPTGSPSGVQKGEAPLRFQ